MEFENVCRHNKFGFCKFGNLCRKRHIEEICDNKDCETRLCGKRHPRLCRFFQEFGRCKFGEFCRFKHVEYSESIRNDREIEELKALLVLKDDQILAVAHKIDKIVRYLKSKDHDVNDCENTEKIEFHELDEDDEYEEKMKHLVENENTLKIFQEEEVVPEDLDFSCNFCENKFEKEIRLLAHFWQDHRGKSTFIVVPRTPPP